MAAITIKAMLTAMILGPLLAWTSSPGDGGVIKGISPFVEAAICSVDVDRSAKEKLEELHEPVTMI